MLRSTKQLYAASLGTEEGEIGHVKDFYFDDQHWAIRYVVVDTGSWLPRRLVLLSPHAFGNPRQDCNRLLVNLTLKQIENSPAIEEHQPVSRQYEEAYYRYYGWPAYWNGDGMRGASGIPMVPPPHLVPIEEENRGGRTVDGDDPHLRSTKSVTGYQIQTHEGAIGHVTDFMIDDKSWAIRHLIVEAGPWFERKEIAVLPIHVERISYEESTVFVNVTKESIQEATDWQKPQPVYLETRNFDD